MRHFVPGPGIDEPLVWYEATSGARDRRWFLTDTLGPVVVVVDRFGRPLRINTYGPYGGPNGNNLGRFQFAGREWLPEIGLLHARNRAYMPGIGRFLQPDPVGMAGGMNLYEYAGSSPLTRTDPWGLQASRPVQSILVTADGIPDDFDVYGMWWGYWLTRPSEVRNPREEEQEEANIIQVAITPFSERCDAASTPPLTAGARALFDARIDFKRVEEKFIQHLAPLNRRGTPQSTFTADITSPADLWRNVGFVTLSYQAVDTGVSVPGDYGIDNRHRITGRLPIIAGHDAFAYGYGRRGETQYLTVIYSGLQPQANGELPIRRFVTAYPGCP